MDNSSILRTRARAARQATRAPIANATLSTELPVPIGSSYSLLRSGALALVVAASSTLLVRAQPASPAAGGSGTSTPAPGGETARRQPIVIRADSLTLRPDVDAAAEGEVDFRQATTTIRADRVHYDAAADLVTARGHVRIVRPGAVYSGPEVQLTVRGLEGYFLQPTYEFESLGAGGRAARLDFLGPGQVRAEQAVYTSCPRDGSGVPDWLLRADRVTLDFDVHKGVAEGAVLRFLGAPILALPTMSFPISDERLSGWLPPSVGLDNRNGLILGVPWYWNIAPNRDATIVPTLITRRGAAVEGEFRYLERSYAGQLNLHLLPYDRSLGHARGAIRFSHDGQLGDGWRVQANALHVSDQDYWKDFPAFATSLTPRLLAQDVRASRDLRTPLGEGELYARTQFWQLMQTGSGDELITAPYQRSPQLGWRARPATQGGFATTFETEINHFTLPAGSADPTAPTGWRWHALGSLARPMGDGSWWLTPKLGFNAAHYAIEQTGSELAARAWRVIPTASLDGGLVFEREVNWFGHSQRQTLEPRLLYLNTPYRDQSHLPIFDSAPKTFNFVSIFAEDPFSGIDRVPDANQFTAGVTTRLIDAASGAETARLSIAQRLLLREQRITPDGLPNRRRISDLLLEGSSTLIPNWRFDGAVQYNPDRGRVVDSTLATRWTPGPYRTLSAGYRLTNNLGLESAQAIEQLELGWQWPVYRGTARPVGASNGCGGTLYAVGRVNYSLKDNRITDSVVGAEYDAGCWIGRIVAERLSTGTSEATTRLMLQLELVGLSRLGSNPLQVLKDNIPGYRLLREPHAGGAAAAAPTTIPP